MFLKRRQSAVVSFVILDFHELLTPRKKAKCKKTTTPKVNALLLKNNEPIA
jgi:hypothetical protein